jgi:hypothetical protein
MDNLIADAQNLREELRANEEELSKKLDTAKAKLQKLVKQRGEGAPENRPAYEAVSSLEEEARRIDQRVKATEAEIATRISEKNANVAAENAAGLATFLAACGQLFRLQIKAKDGDGVLKAMSTTCLPKGVEEFSFGGVHKWRDSSTETAQGFVEVPSSSFCSCTITASGSHALAQTFPEGLTKLSLSKLKLGDEGIGIIAANGLPACLQELDLHCCGLGAHGCVPLGTALPAGLRCLDLGDNRLIGDAGIFALVEAMPRLSKLRLLNISSCGISQKGLAMLANTLPAEIEVLELSGNELFDNGAFALAEVIPRLGQLYRLNMKFCELHLGGKDRIRAAWLQSGKVDTPLYDLPRQVWSGLDL